MILSPSCRSRKVCQISSVINGINGCSNCNSCSKIFSVSSYVFRSIGWPYAGLIISSNQDENSSRKVVYTVISASEIRYWSNWVFNVSFTFPNRCLNHSNAKREEELNYTRGFLTSVMKKLSNEKFVNGAPEQVVANERKKQADAEVKIAAIEAQLKGL